MRMLALVSNPDRPSVRYRVLAFQSLFRQAGWSLECRSCNTWSSWWLLRECSKADAVLVQRRLFNSWLLPYLRRASRRLIYDFDDAIFGNDSFHPGGLDNSRRLRGFANMVECADVVLAGNDYLCRQAQRWTTPDRVQLMPTCLDPAKYALARHPEGRPLQMAWIGSSSTLRSLERIRPLLENLGRRHTGLSLKIVCDRTMTFDHLPVQFVPWSEATETGALAQADIGISWLPDDRWSRGKCGLKVLQYMAAGLPVIANPVGVQKDLVTHGETGFLAETDEEWLEAVSWLGKDAQLRRQMGLAGRRRVEEAYSLSRGAGVWQQLLSRSPQALVS